MKSLMLHAGGWVATEQDVEAVPVPESTESYTVVPYMELIRQTRDILKLLGIEEVGHEWALSQDRQRFFGVIHTAHQDTAFTKAHLSIGMRNAYDKSMSLVLLAGQKVWLCDNTGYSADVLMTRRHTGDVFKDLRLLVFQGIEKARLQFTQDMSYFATLEKSRILRADADHLLLEAAREGAIPFTQIPKVDAIYTGRHEIELLKGDTFHRAFEPNTAWRLFNAFTEIYKDRMPGQRQTESKRLFRVFRQYIPPDPGPSTVN